MAELGKGTFMRTLFLPFEELDVQSFGYFMQKWWQNGQYRLVTISLETYQSKIKNHVLPVWRGKPIAKITSDDVQDWINGPKMRCLSSKTVREILMIWRKIFGAWARYEPTAVDPSRYIKLALPDPDDIRAFSHAEK